MFLAALLCYIVTEFIMTFGYIYLCILFILLLFNLKNKVETVKPLGLHKRGHTQKYTKLLNVQQKLHLQYMW